MNLAGAFSTEKIKDILLSEETTKIILVSVAKVLSAGIGLLTIIIIARSLGTFCFGLFSLSMGVMLVALEFCGQGIDWGLVRVSSLYLQKDREKARLVFKAALGMKIKVACLVLIGGIILSKPLAILVFNNPEIVTPLRVVFVGVLATSLWTYILATLQAHQLFKKFAFLDIVNSLLKIGLIGILSLVFTATLFRVLVVYVVVIPLLCFFIGLVVIPRYFLFAKGAGEERKIEAELFGFSKWIIASGIISILYSRLDVLMLGYFKMVQAVAFYSAAFYLAFGIDVLLISVVTVLLPRISQLSTRQEYINYIQKSLGITILISLVLSPALLIARPLILTLYTPEFAASIPIFIVLFLASMVTLIVFPIALIFYSMKLPHYVTFGDLGILILSFLGNYLFIPKYGAIAAAWVTLFSRMAIGSVYLVFIYLKIFLPSQPKA